VETHVLCSVWVSPALAPPLPRREEFLTHRPIGTSGRRSRYLHLCFRDAALVELGVATVVRATPPD